MAEGSLHDPDLAALALKQARGDMIEAVFLIRAFAPLCRASGHRCPWIPPPWL
jgi:alpha-D-ribose 1-methylphosphonate 5-triphosphate synthase subunit PhnI